MALDFSGGNPLENSSISTNLLNLIFSGSRQDLSLYPLSPSSIKLKHFLITSSGRLLLCVPSKQINIFRPLNPSYNLWAWSLCMRLSSSPWMKQISFLWGSFDRRCETMSIFSMFRPDIDSTLHFKQLKTQGKKRWKKQQQALGTNFDEDSLQRWVRSE